MKIPETRYFRGTAVSLGSTKDSPKGQRSRISGKAATTWRACCSVVVDEASSGTHGSSRAVSDNHSPFCTQVIRAGHRITGQRTVGERSHVPGHRVIRRVRGNTIMSPGISRPGRNAHTVLFASNKTYPRIRNYERPKTSAVSQKRVTGSSPIKRNLVNVVHCEIIEVGNCITQGIIFCNNKRKMRRDSRHFILIFVKTMPYTYVWCNWMRI